MEPTRDIKGQKRALILRRLPTPPALSCSFCAQKTDRLLLLQEMKTHLAGVLALPCAPCCSWPEPRSPLPELTMFLLQVWRPTTEETAETLRVPTEVITEESGQLLVSPQYCGPVTVYRCARQFLGELVLQHCFKERICVRRHYVLLMWGAVTCSWWILTNDFFMSSSQCPIRYASAARVTLAERIKGLLTRVASCAFTEYHIPKTSGGVQVTEPEPSTSPWTAGQGTPEAAGGSADIDREVPALHAYTQIKRIENFPLKLIALHQAYTIILNNAECQKDVFESGRKILGNHSKCQGADYLSAGIHHFNFIDIVNEVVIFGVQCRVRPQICPTLGGFLDHLLVMISSFSASTEQSRPRAKQYRLMIQITLRIVTIQNAMMRLLEDIFALGESVYEHPESVAEAVWNLVVDHVTCEGDSAVLTCGEGVLKIQAANYGRTDSTTCIAGRPVNQITKNDCYATSSLTEVANRCEGKITCTVPASNSVFSDPCVYTYKYLTMVYSCVV
ncbi:hypothetical protein AOLI_G00070510 [Acnodon oligacanthus]